MKQADFSKFDLYEKDINEPQNIVKISVSPASCHDQHFFLYQSKENCILTKPSS